MVRSALAWMIRNYIYYTPSHPGRGLLGKLAHRLQPQGFPAEVTPGVRFYIRLNSPEDYAYWMGQHELQGEVECFRAQLRPGMTVLDVGANKGLYSLVSARAVGPTGHVYAFEPVPALLSNLQGHIELNQITNVTMVGQAACDRIGTTTFFVNRTGSGTGQGSLVRAITQEQITVETTTLDEFKRRNGIARVGAIKIDVEGAELLVLAGMEGILREDRPVILIEHNETALRRQGTSGQALFERLVGHGYRGHLIKDGRTSPVTEIQPPVCGGPEPLSNYIFLPVER